MSVTTVADADDDPLMSACMVDVELVSDSTSNLPDFQVEAKLDLVETLPQHNGQVLRQLNGVHRFL